MRIVCFSWVCCLLSMLSSIAIFPIARAIPDHRARHGPVLTQPFRLPTEIIRDVIAVVDHNDPLELAAFANRMQKPGSLHLLIAAWHHAHQPANFALGPYRMPDWLVPGTQLAIPLRFACPHREHRLEVIVTFTIRGWQVSEIRRLI
ncbi:hypothetical protein [Chloroflexus sp.]|uniref:hypothetical protein n=1 Tax=Chloroflexus sp. TaxID=1904827 RepID=UPI002ACE35D0|nr:hypothetical protein [Chloroflexus sp.]